MQAHEIVLELEQQGNITTTPALRPSTPCTHTSEMVGAWVEGPYLLNSQEARCRIGLIGPPEMDLALKLPRSIG